MNNKFNLQVGDKIKIGKKYAEEHFNFEEGEIITLIQGYFDVYNGLYNTTETAPSIKSKYSDDGYDSIYHLFGNSMENFMDCEIIKDNSEISEIE